jgi:hypothetical protein
MQHLDFNFELKLSCHEENFTPFPMGIFDDLKLLVRLRTEMDEEDERKNTSYQDFVSRCLMRASTSLATPPKANATEPIVLRCIQLGQILFLYQICPSMSVSGVYSQSIALALRGCLEVGSSEAGDRMIWSPEVLCWLLVNGAITQQVKSLQLWYLRRVIEFTRYQRLQTFNQLEAMLRKTVWVEGQFGSACRSLWMEILAAQPSEDK